MWLIVGGDGEDKMVTFKIDKDKEAIAKLYGKIQREKIEDVFKGRLAIEDFVIDFAPTKNEYGFILDNKHDWTLVEKDNQILLIPLRRI